MKLASTKWWLYDKKELLKLLFDNSNQMSELQSFVFHVRLYKS